MSTRPSATSESRRPAVLLGLACALLIGGVVSATTSSARPTVRPQSDAAVGGAAQSAAFYCTGLENEGGKATSDVAIADLARTPRTVELTIVDEEGHVAVRQLLVRPGVVKDLVPGNFVRGPYEAVTVDALGGDVAVSEALHSVNGTAVAPCMTQAKSSWWVTGGSTEPGQGFVLCIYNPYESRAVASVDLDLPSGSLPNAYSGLVLGPHTLEALWVHDVAPNESPITAHVHATDGDVVVYGVNRATGRGTSISLLPASPGPSSEVVVPSASSDPSTSLSLVFAGAGATGVAATVQVLAPTGCTTRCPAPFSVTVASGSVTSLALTPTSRVPSDEQLAVVVTSKRPGVVVTERVKTLNSTGQGAPLDDPSFAGGRHLVLVDPLGSTIAEVGVVNPTGHAISMHLETVARSGPVRFGSTFVIAAHTDLVLDASALRGVVDGVLELVADGNLAAAAQVKGATVGAGTLVAVPR